MDRNESFSEAIRLIDAANDERPGGLVYGQRMSAALEELYPGASIELKLAARAQHIRRHLIPRESFPMDRAGYHHWRMTLYDFHAEQAGAILSTVGYSQEVIDRVGSLLRKKRLKADPETQALEDVICAVFLKHEFADFAAKHDDEKVIGILRRTWAKMSPVGHQAAQSLLPTLPERARDLVNSATVS